MNQPAKQTLNVQHLLTPEQVGEILGVSPKTLNKWRCTKTNGPKFLHVGKLARYRPVDVQAYIDSLANR